MAKRVRARNPPWGSLAKVANKNFFSPEVERLLNRIRWILGLSLITHFLFQAAYNSYVDAVVPDILPELQRLPHDVEFYRGILHQQVSFFFSLEISPALKLLLMLVCTVCLRSIRVSRELKAEVVSLREENSLII